MTRCDIEGYQERQMIFCGGFNLMSALDML
jgi:hypothetical protein